MAMTSEIRFVPAAHVAVAVRIVLAVAIAAPS
jgi:hypothetical protein